MRLPVPLALVDQLADPVQLQPLRLGADRVGLGQLVDRHLAGDVLGAGLGQVVVAASWPRYVRSHSRHGRPASSAVVGDM